jgi:uncharacterized protein YqhQ
MEGFIRLGIFLIYIVLVSKMKDIRRVFEYHGAEHKTIHCYEHDEELDGGKCTKVFYSPSQMRYSIFAHCHGNQYNYIFLYGVAEYLYRILARLLLLP